MASGSNVIFPSLSSSGNIVWTGILLPITFFRHETWKTGCTREDAGSSNLYAIVPVGATFVLFASCKFSTLILKFWNYFSCPFLFRSHKPASKNFCCLNNNALSLSKVSFFRKYVVLRIFRGFAISQDAHPKSWNHKSRVARRRNRSWFYFQGKNNARPLNLYWASSGFRTPAFLDFKLLFSRPWEPTTR